ncbi:TorF family putative porin [Aestuariibacter sp. AA17]|uniref:TorF family putative porin n=1 Tax=Fluctibacter corallii TaxID=2984329 RepID=A0ABT3A6Z6_9ALTE|nr:TorF family putative porin [Aestuariibacter sp. AA17]MCV2884368.1 TorF family putative porin [Aestuariibacter sp. AA17]
MKKSVKLGLIGLSFIACSGSVMAELSANIGYVSQYHFRGIEQTSSGSASAGLDLENQGFYLGTWAADVKDGLEVDVYGGYGFELENGLSLGIGATTYQYTGDFDSAYNEVNLYAGFGMFSLEYSVGKQEDDADLGITETDYTFLALTLEHEGFSATVGSWGDETDGEYFELGYATEVGGFDVGIGVLFSGSDLDDDESMFLSISKTFDL